MDKSKTDWRRPANGKNYHGKITMMEVKMLLKEFDKNHNPETSVGNYVEVASYDDLTNGNVVNIRAVDNNKQQDEKENKGTEK